MRYIAFPAFAWSTPSPLAALAPDRRAGADAPARRAARAGLHAHRERRPLQRIHLPRHLADRRQARRAGRLRLRALERLLPRHLGIEHQLARGLRRVHALQPRVGLLRRLQGQLRRQRLLVYDLGTLYYYYPGTQQSRRRQRRHLGALRARSTGSGSAPRLRTTSTTTSARNPTGKKTDGTWYFDFYANYPVGDTGFTLLGHFGILNVNHDGSGNSKASYNDWKVGASYAVPDGRSRAWKSARTTPATTPRRRFYTDLTGYNTAKDVGVVYVKKTF